VRVLRTALLLACVAAVAVSCDRPGRAAVGGGDVVTLRFWNGFTGPDGRTMLGLVKRFNEENPHVRVVMQRMEWGTYYNKLFVASLGNRGPEVFVIHADNVTRFHHAGFLRPMDDLTGEGGIDATDFDENVWAAVARDGKHLGIPLDIHLLGMFYNRVLFREAGIDRPPATREEFVDALRKLTRDTNGDGANETWGFVFTWLRTNAYTLMRQWGGDVLTPDGKTVILNSPENIAAMQFAVDLIAKEKVALPPENSSSFGGAMIGFRQGRVGLMLEGIYVLPELRRQSGLEVGAAATPVLGKQPAAWGSSHVMCVRKDLDGPELAAAKRFVKFLSDNSLDWAEGGQIPVRKSLRDSDRFHAMTAQYEFSKQIPHAAYWPASPYINEYLSEFDLAVERILKRSQTPEQALKTAADNIRAVLKRYEAEAAP
jgi:multiple sugar transport system substrate-binding protein